MHRRIEWDNTVAPHPPLSMVGSRSTLRIARRMAFDHPLLVRYGGDMYEREQHGVAVYLVRSFSSCRLNDR